MHNLLNEIEIFEIEKQHVERKVLSVFKNNRLTEIQIQQLRREIEKDEITPKRVDIVELNYGEFSGTENV